MSNILLSSIAEFITLQRDYNNGQADIDSVNAAMRRFAKSLDEHIDYRVKAALEERRKLIGKEKISLAEELNSTVKDTVKSIQSIQALSSAPSPPDSGDKKTVEDFISDYNTWYEEKRKKGIEIE